MHVTISLRALLALIILLGVVGGGLILTDWLVLTDAERIEELLKQWAEAAERHEVDYITEECLADDFRLGDMDRTRTRLWAKEALTVFKVTSVKPISTEADVHGDLADVEVKTFIRTTSTVGDQRIDWKIEMVRDRRDHWRIRRVRAFYFLHGQRRELDLPNVVRYLP